MRMNSRSNKISGNSMHLQAIDPALLDKFESDMLT